jgi:hypothetical protein
MENMFIKHHITRYVNATSSGLKTLESFMMITVTKENTLFGPKIKLSGIKWGGGWANMHNQKYKETCSQGLVHGDVHVVCLD